MAQLLAAPYSYFADSNGLPLNGGKIYTYAAGTVTPQAAYTDSTGITPLANPVPLDAAGRAQIWLSGSYKIVVKDSLDNTISTTDNITALSNSGDMTKAIYDPANIGEQLVGLAAVQTLTNKTLTAPVIQSLTPRQPDGRLTLITATPIINSDQTGKGTIYYTPYIGDACPIYNGNYYVPAMFTEATLTLNATNHPTTKVYDVYASLQAGVFTLSAMYWGSNTARSTSAGGKTGAANASILQKNGIWVNNAAISASDSFNGTTGVAIAQYQGTYLGSFYTTADAQTGIALKPSAASGGSNNIIGLFNAYNRVQTTAISRDSNSPWTYSTATWRTADGSTSNRVSWIDGLQQINLCARYSFGVSFAVSGNKYSGGVNLDSTSATPNLFATNEGVANEIMTINQAEPFFPQLGFHYIQAMEYSDIGANSVQASGTQQSLQWEGEI